MTASLTADDLPAAPIAEGPTEETEQQKRRRRRKAAILLLLIGLLATLATIGIWYLIFRQPITPPIPVIPQSQMPAYSTSIYGTQRPVGVAVSPAGDRIYVAESAGGSTAAYLDAAGNKIATMAPPESTGSSHAPVYVAIDPLTAEVYVSDRLAGTIYVYNADGVYQHEFTLAQPRPGWQPLGLAFDKDGHLYVTDLSGPYQKVLVIDRAANVTRTLGENDQLSFPNGIGVDGDGNVFVTDSNNGRLLMFGATGTVTAQVGRGAGVGNLGLPRGLSVDSQGRVFVADATGQGVFVFRAPRGDTRRLEYLGFFGGEGVGDGTFEYPNSVAVDARGRLYVADTFNDRVQIWSY